MVYTDMSKKYGMRQRRTRLDDCTARVPQLKCKTFLMQPKVPRPTNFYEDPFPVLPSAMAHRNFRGGLRSLRFALA